MEQLMKHVVDALISQHTKTIPLWRYRYHINSVLMKNCNHNWIDDVIETAFSEKNICYCSNCFIYK